MLRNQKKIPIPSLVKLQALCRIILVNIHALNSNWPFSSASGGTKTVKKKSQLGAERALMTAAQEVLDRSMVIKTNVATLDRLLWSLCEILEDTLNAIAPRTELKKILHRRGITSAHVRALLINIQAELKEKNQSKRL